MEEKTITTNPRPEPSPGAALPNLTAYIPILERLPQAALLADTNGTVVAMNRAGLSLMEAGSAEAVVGKSCISFLVPEMQAKVAAAYGKLVESPINPTRYELLTLKGNRRTIEVGVIPLVTSSAGGVELILGLARDVTEQSRAESEQALLAAIVESSEDAIVSISPELRIMSWNQGACRLLGYTAQEAIGASTTIYIPPERRASGEAYLRDLMTKLDRVHSFEVPCLRKDGSRVDVWTICCGIRDAAGRLLGMSAIHRDLTERRRAEREQALLAAIVEFSEDAIITKAPDHTIRTWNAGAERLYGYRAEEVVGKPVSLLMPAGHAEELNRSLDRVLNGETIRDLEARRKRKDGSLIDISLSEARIIDGSGRVVGISAIERDISERLRARSLEDQMAAIVKYSNEAIYSLGPGHVVQTWNAGAERMFGYRAEEVIGKRSRTMIPECQPQLDEMLARVMGGETVTFESRRRRKDGVILEVEVTASPIYNQYGKVESLAVITRDITQRKRAETALLETQRQLRQRMRQLVAVSRLSRAALGKIELEKLAAEIAVQTAQTLGTDSCVIAELSADRRALVLRAAYGCATSGPDRAAVDVSTDSHAAWVLHGGEPVIVDDFALETRFQRSALLESPDAVSALSVPVPDDESAFGIISLACRTRREFSRDDLNTVQAIAYLLGQVLERRRTEADLRSARDAALESARAKSAFLANMSHEIRTPLNSIVGLSGLLLDTRLTPEQHDFAQTIRLSSDVLLETINNVLDFSKISTGKTLLEHTEFDPRVVVQTAMDLLADAARNKNLEMSFVVAPDVPPVLRGDPGRLRQVLVNLLGNAVKFTPSGQVVLKASVDSQTDNTAVLRIEVTDTGIGIAAEGQALLFEPFFQADSSTTRKFGGSGLGLAICKGLMTLMGGKIGVRSRLGEGSTFWFTVGLEKAPATALTPQAAGQLSGVRVLVVDDAQANLQVTRRQLETWGMRVDVVEGGAQALDMMRKEAPSDPYALVLVDMQMPGMDGLELAQKIKADPKLGQTRLVMMSSAGEPPAGEDRAKLFAAWFTKPVRPAQMLRGLALLAEPAGTPTAPTANAQVQRSTRILLAEDNPINQKVAVLQLKKMGYAPAVVGNGREALEALKAAQYDLVLMDCQMPEMDGYEATRAIRAMEKDTSRHTTVVAMTAFGLSGDREKCLESGMDDYLAKPIKAEMLREMLERWLPKTGALANPDSEAGNSIDQLDS